jgi:glycine/D-amino acid oxidase-like deaminating enzyme
MAGAPLALSATSDVATTVHWAGGRSDAALYPPLEAHVTADVAIVGAGFMGLSAALTLAKAGRSVAVLEAIEPGAGASGRNAAHVQPGWALRKPKDAIKRFGPAQGGAMNRIAAGAAKALFELIRQHDIDCDAVPGGHLSIATTESGLRAGKEHTAAWAAEGVAVSMVGATEIRRRMDIENPVGGWTYHDGGTLNPLSLARGLAATAAKHGARIHGHTDVVSLAQLADGWKVITPQGSVTAKQVILAMNAYGKNLWPGFAHVGYVTPCAMVASEPLRDISAFGPQKVWNIADDKTLFGGVLDKNNVMLSSVLVGAGSATPSELVAIIRRKFKKYFPSLPVIHWDKCWIGNFLLTADGFPKVVNPAPGLYAGFGCNGAGIAMAPALGRSIAERILQTADVHTLYPLSPLKSAPLPRAVPWAIRNILLPVARIIGG